MVAKSPALGNPAGPSPSLTKAARRVARGESQGVFAGAATGAAAASIGALK